MKIDCIICGQPMVLEKKFKSTQCKSSPGKYRIRRFHCSFCEYSELICAYGELDLHDTRAIEEINKMYEQEIENRT